MLHDSQKAVIPAMNPPQQACAQTHVCVFSKHCRGVVYLTTQTQCTMCIANQSTTLRNAQCELQVHPLSITRLGLLVKDVWTYQQHGRLQAWKSRPFVFIGPPDSEGICLVTAIPGMRAPKKHPVTKVILPNSHDGTQ